MLRRCDYSVEKEQYILQQQEMLIVFQ